MRWTPGRRSEHVEDRRGQTGGGFRGGPVSIGVVLVLVALSLVTGRNFLSLVDPNTIGDDTPAGEAGPVETSPEEEKIVEMLHPVLDDNQETWTRLLQGQYQPAKLILFRRNTRTACGYGQSATGPFYCPPDTSVYLDVSFFDDLHRRFGAPGDFAQAYVVAHEIGHHVQNLTGVESRVRQAQQQRPGAANDLSVRMELQADCYAGVWGHSAAQRGHLEAGDVDEGLRAAAAIGDDRMQQMGGGTVQPESFTHGSSEQRMQWFRRGFESGNPNACDTFGGMGG